MYNIYMKFKDNIRLYAWIEFLIWFIILALCIWGYRFYKYEKFKELPSYQIFMPDVDGMIVGSPVKYMGVQVGYVKNIKLLSHSAYVRFIITEKGLELPQGVIATVEFNGLGGSKSLELYPPDNNLKTDRLVVIRNPKRLHDSMNLLNDMFDKIDSIGVKFNNFTEKLGLINKENHSLQVTPADISKNIDQADNFVNNMIKNRDNFQNKLKGWKNE